MDGDPAGEGVGGAAHREHAVGNPAVEDQELVVARGHPNKQLVPLGRPGGVEMLPMVERPRPQEHRFTAQEGAGFPPSQRIHKRKRTLLDVGVELLLAPFHVSSSATDG